MARRYARRLNATLAVNDLSERVQVVSVAPLLAEAIRRIDRRKSLPVLFAIRGSRTRSLTGTRRGWE